MTGPPRKRRSRHNVRGTRVVDLFAQAISESGKVPAAARSIGISTDYGWVLMKRIRRDLGAQAI